MPEFLNAAQAADLMGEDPSTVSALCKNGMLSGATRVRDNGPWQIPKESVDAWIKAKGNTNKKRIVIPKWLHNVALGTIAALIFGGVSALADLGGARETLLRYGVLPAYKAAEADEVLIVISEFHVSEGAQDTEAHNEIKRAIERAAEEFEYTTLRVEIEPRMLKEEEISKVKAIGEKARADMFIWGTDTGARVTVRFLNFNEPEGQEVYYERSELQSTQLADPRAYAEYITSELPASVRALALQAIATTYRAKGQTKLLAEALEVEAETSQDYLRPEDRAWIYFELGLLYKLALDNSEKAIDSLTKGISIHPENAALFNARGNVYLHLEDYNAALKDYNIAVELGPSAMVYSNRSSAYSFMHNYHAALADLDAALALEPSDPVTHFNRGSASLQIGNTKQAIDDLTYVINETSEGWITLMSLWYRGFAFAAEGEFDRAIEDYNKVLQVVPGDFDILLNRGIFHREAGNFQEALEDYRYYLEFNPDNSRKAEVGHWIEELEREMESKEEEGDENDH